MRDMAERWFDTHVHLERYGPADQRRLFDEARDAGVEGMLAVSTSLESSERTVALGVPVLRAVGVHPISAHRLDATRLRALASHESVVAIGECGFTDATLDWRAQQGAFEVQATIARDLALPLILHIDGPLGWDRFVAMAPLLEGMTVIRHYFSGEEHQAHFHAERGQYISFGRPLIREPEQQRVARLIPPALLLIETDSYPLAGRTTEPKSLPEVGRALSASLGTTLEACSRLLWENTARALALTTERSETGPPATPA